MSAPEGYFEVAHGNLVLNVPRRMFKGAGAVLDEEEAAKFYHIVHTRYPWVNENSYNVMLRKARKVFMDIRDEETGGIYTARRLADKGDYKGAVKHLKKHLEDDPEDADAWMELGRMLCNVGDMEEGYKAFNKAKSL